MWLIAKLKSQCSPVVPVKLAFGYELTQKNPMELVDWEHTYEWVGGGQIDDIKFFGVCEQQ